MFVGTVKLFDFGLLLKHEIALSAAWAKKYVINSLHKDKLQKGLSHL